VQEACPQPSPGPEHDGIVEQEASSSASQPPSIQSETPSIQFEAVAIHSEAPSTTGSTAKAATPAKTSFREMLNARRNTLATGQTPTPPLTIDSSYVEFPTGDGQDEMGGAPPEASLSLAAPRTPHFDLHGIYDQEGHAGGDSGFNVHEEVVFGSTNDFSNALHTVAIGNSKDTFSGCAVTSASPNSSTLTRTGTAVFDVDQVYNDQDEEDDCDDGDRKQSDFGSETLTMPRVDDSDSVEWMSGDIAGGNKAAVPYLQTSDRITAFLNNTKKSNAYSVSRTNSAKFDERSL
jgi:hypothetical protein